MLSHPDPATLPTLSTLLSLVLMIATVLPSADTVPLGLTVQVQQRRAGDGGSSPDRIVRAAHVSDHAAGMRVGVDEGVWSGSSWSGMVVCG